MTKTKKKTTFQYEHGSWSDSVMGEDGALMRTLLKRNDGDRNAAIAELLPKCGAKRMAGGWAPCPTKGITELETPSGTVATATPATSVTAPATKPEGPLPVLEWADTGTEWDFGTINEGDVVEHTYVFKNTGQAPLIIENAKPSCGCTVPSWTKEPIPVGGTGEILVKFDSKGKPNTQTKTVTITSNTWPKVTTLRFKTFVTPKAK